MRLGISHRTDYRYSEPVSQSHHVLHLSPRPHPAQSVVRHEVAVDPLPASRRDGLDAFGNPVIRLTVEDDHELLTIQAETLIDVDAAPAVDLDGSCDWQAAVEAVQGRSAPADLEVQQYACFSPHVPASLAIARYARESFPPGRPLLAATADLNARIHRDFVFDDTATDVSTPVDEVFEIRRGVCQDFAHLALAGLRAQGLAARYVSGYLLTDPPEGQLRLVGADASHAWISVWAPEIGWVDFDPTNDRMPSDGHITIACGRDYGDVAPIGGVILGGGEHTVDVAVDVTPAEG